MDLWKRPISSHAKALRSGKLSSVALTEHYLDRIARYDDTLCAFIHVSPTARECAIALDKEIKNGQWRGPLHGVPVAIKDNYLTADMPTTAGTLAKGIEFAMRDSACAAPGIARACPPDPVVVRVPPSPADSRPRAWAPIRAVPSACRLRFVAPWV